MNCNVYFLVYWTITYLSTNNGLSRFTKLSFCQINLFMSISRYLTFYLLINLPGLFIIISNVSIAIILFPEYIGLSIITTNIDFSYLWTKYFCYSFVAFYVVFFWEFIFLFCDIKEEKEREKRKYQYIFSRGWDNIEDIGFNIIYSKYL